MKHLAVRTALYIRAHLNFFVLNVLITVVIVVGTFWMCLFLFFPLSFCSFFSLSIIISPILKKKQKKNLYIIKFTPQQLTTFTYISTQLHVRGTFLNFLNNMYWTDMMTSQNILRTKSIGFQDTTVKLLLCLYVCKYNVNILTGPFVKTTAFTSET